MSTIIPAPLSTVALPPLDKSQTPWPGEFQQVDGHEVHVRVTPGDGPPAVYVHGLGGSATNWTDLAAQLKDHVSGYSIDLPGFGRSEPIPGYDFSLATHARTVIKYLETLSQPVHLLGNSMGGAISVMVAASRPDLVRTLTLVSPAVPDLRPRLDRMSDPRMALAVLPIVGARVRRELAKLSAHQRTRQMLELCFADPSVVPDHRIEESIKENEERARQKWAGQALNRSTFGLMQSWLTPGPKSLWRLLPLVKAPTLVLWGENDRLVSVRKGPRTARSLPQGRLLVLPKTGHVAQMERPATVARAVLGMWEAVDRRSW
ncbi:alpha/beta fold hydrolase [Lentzea flaviverrucosa]|uniref:Pimeloyl-ACP methyl ester carboxylesterase n=1 Tax=Lentzea flaviverrucosa TaxID=200379 RepID=A0A1H9MVX0_9PSEU|nr:alpha/beta fold hydrolase [Lentzea flaviverrucosa]RDI30758.1 pimeloyl-ACP methyl ester carboxylesterase [Lentzea flaviverrucosa]SER27844.1 Pimeloyl-ACP methyl ester carboxylesterase [Lentzea flaviverrucosa]